MLAGLAVVARHAIDRAVVLDQHQIAIGQLLALAHVALLGQDRRQLGHLLNPILADQPRRVLHRQQAPALCEQLIDRLRATVRLHERQRVHRHSVVALWKQRLGSGCQRVQMARPPDPAPHAGRLHQPIAIKQRQVLPHTDRADPQRIAQLGRSHIAVPPEQRQDLLACLALLAMV